MKLAIFISKYLKIRLQTANKKQNKTFLSHLIPLFATSKMWNKAFLWRRLFGAKFSEFNFWQTRQILWPYFLSPSDLLITESESESAHYTVHMYCSNVQEYWCSSYKTENFRALVQCVESESVYTPIVRWARLRTLILCVKSDLIHYSLTPYSHIVRWIKLRALLYSSDSDSLQSYSVSKPTFSTHLQ